MRAAVAAGGEQGAVIAAAGVSPERRAAAGATGVDGVGGEDRPLGGHGVTGLGRGTGETGTARAGSGRSSSP
jgi:hypothetical protein